ncbi:uncharacterized protein LOC134022900 [Osmerus eperlanus]|uniref:uncharacterized protein LOC134022900 n=1 Tax=Osmerus eperlanus TaxID=29151 RepID=UPI002E1608F3
METKTEIGQQPDTQTSSSEEEDFEDGFVQMLASHLEQEKDVESGCEEDDDYEKQMEPGTSQTEQSSSVASQKMVSPPEPSTWDLMCYINKWKRAHSIGHHINMLTRDPGRKALIIQHELQCKTSIPLPVVCMLEGEALQILREIEKEYMYNFGATHPLTLEAQQNIEKLETQVTAKEGNRPVPEKGWLQRVLRWGRTLAIRLGGSWGLG